MTNNAMKNLRYDFLSQMDAYINNNCGHGDYLEWKDFFYTNFKKHLFEMVAEDSTLWNDTCKFFEELTKENQNMKTWESRAKYVERVYGDYVDWEERFYECPECGDRIYECDWDGSELYDMICPICGFDGEEGEENF